MTVREITKTRTSLGVSQKQIAKILKKHPTFISKLENGKRKLTPEIQRKIAGAFLIAKKARKAAK